MEVFTIYLQYDDELPAAPSILRIQHGKGGGGGLPV